MKFNKIHLSIFFTLPLICLSTLLIFNNCGGSGGSSSSEENNNPVPADYAWKNISPYGGFISSVAFHPATSSEIWLSGDDAGGLYRSTDSGNTWTLLTTPPADQSTYSLVFDPNDPNIIYAPNHFGRGFLKSTNAGASWSILGTGLPTAIDEKRIYDMAIDPASTSTIYVCLEGGLYKSTDSGQIFTQITSATFDNNSDTDFRAVVVSNTSRVFVGTASGRVYDSVDGVATWNEITSISLVPVTDLALTDNALYIAYRAGFITKTTDFTNATLTAINDPSSGGDIESGVWTKLIALSGSSAATDILYIGTVYKDSSTKWGFFVSTDGGSTYTKKVNGLNGHSVFSMAVNPTDSNHIVIGTVNGGVYITTDAGDNWNASSTGIIATDSYAFAEDPFNSQHLLMSSTASLTGTSKVFETNNGGTSWSEVSTFSDKNVKSLFISPDSPNTILTGTFFNGIYKTTTGSSGAWSQVFSKSIEINRIRQDKINSSKLYVMANEYQAPAISTDVGIYFSSDGGDSWSQKINFTIVDIETHPNNEDEAISLATDVFATTDNFSSTFNSLGLAAFGKIFLSAAFDPSNPSTLFVGSSTGELYKTTNYVASGAGVTWTEISTPARSVGFTDIEIIDSSIWYVACWTGDTQVQSDSTPGIIRTTDGGASWSFLNSGLYSSRLIWKFQKSPSVAGRFYGGLWGGGFMQLDD